jgi:D-alanyl-D-alanine dipeptidase
MKRLGIFALSVFLIFFFASCEQQRQQAYTPGFVAAPEAVQAPAQAMRAPGSLVPLEDIANYTFYIWESGVFELPVAGATGWAAIDIPLYDGASEAANIIAMLAPGQAFTILEAWDDWWFIEIYNTRGWVTNKLCMINLPDILPSIVYNITNATYSLFRSSGRYIPNVTGRVLYHARDFNVRLGREEYIAPVLYGMARKIGAAQQAALADGNTLIMYEAFRPSAAHDHVYENLHALVLADPVVHAGMATPPWNTRWFLAAAPYNHQRGTAVDVSLARIDHYQIKATGDYAFIHISGHTPYHMQTPMHELSIAAVVFRYPVHSRSLTAWKDGIFADEATPATILMHSYLTDAGLIPLASEWWHFNDLVHTDLAVEHDITGEFSTERTFSRPPVNAR